MPAEGWESVTRMCGAFALVAAVAVPVGVVTWRLGRRASPVGLPTPVIDEPVYGLGYLVLFLAQMVTVGVFVQAAGAAGLPARFAGTDEPEAVAVWGGVFGALFAAPVVAVGWWVFRAALGAGWSGRSVAAAVAVGVVGWLAVSPGVYAINAVTEYASSLAGYAPQQHPLVRIMSAADGPAAAVLLAAVAVATPFAEEVVFRGLLLGWLIRQPGWVWLPAGLALVFAAMTAGGPAVRGPAVAFAVALLVGLATVRDRPTVAAVWATATLFAVVHSNVWPSPVPLFVLGLALGAVAVRTGGVLAGTVLHGLFNAVSAVYLLRG